MSHEGNDKVIDRERDELPYKWIVDIGHAWLQVSKREYELNGFQASTHSYQDETYVYLEEDVDATRYLNLYQPNPTEIPEVIYEGLCPVRQMTRISKPKKIQGNKMAKFTVTVELTGHATIEVEAIDVLEARETVQAQYKMVTPSSDIYSFIEEVMPITVTDADGNEVWSI